MTTYLEILQARGREIIAAKPDARSAVQDTIEMFIDESRSGSEEHEFDLAMDEMAYIADGGES